MVPRFLSVALVVAATSVHAAEPERITKLPAAVPTETPEIEAELSALGELLYFDARLSGDGSTSCADCHDPDLGFGDGSELGRGYPGTKHWRNSQTLVNAAFLGGGYHWDGTVPSLLHQVPGGMGTSFALNIDPVMVEERLKQVPYYVEQFNAIWGSDPELARVAEAIAAYERSLVSADSPFDLFAGGDLRALSQEAARGLQLFSGKANCLSCHGGMLATDQAFHNTSVPRNPDLLDDPLRLITFRAAMRGFGIDQTVYEALDRDPGLYAASQDPADLGKFRTPPLRYLKYTAPYMHNGMFYTLEEVVDFYNDGGTEDVFGTKSSLIKPLGLTDSEKRDLVAFLESMSGTEITVAYPELPDYEDQTAPSSGLITASALSNGVIKTDTRSASVSPQNGTSAASDGLQILQSGAASVTESGIEAQSGGLTILPSSGSQSLGALSSGAASTGADGQTVVVVAPGDTLGSIARRELGDVLKYQAIFEANRERIADPNNLVPGTQLVIPGA